MKPTVGLFIRFGYEIRIAGLRKTYRVAAQEFTALNGLNCLIPAARMTVVEGPSGCGKTTLMNIVGAVDFADGGSITVGSHDLGPERNEQKLARYRLTEIGFVFQAFNLIPGLSALDNIQLPMAVLGRPRAERAERAHALLGLMDMDKKAMKRPDELSGGEQQRVAIALALANDPPVILADEPTGNLDSANAAIVTALLYSLANDFGKTVVVCTHDDSVGRRGDQRIKMRDGEVLEVATSRA
ncbi:MAG TPA: ABC transporter ATP-binding protein [Steroidobacteraceae bacterium]